MLSCSVEERPLTLGPIEFGGEDVDAVYNHLARFLREVPAIVVSPTRSGDLLVDPSEVSEQIGLNATVYFTRDCSVTQAFNDRLEPNGLQCYGDALRVYAGHPHFDILGDGANHRFFPPSTLGDEEGRASCLEILRRALAQDVHAWETSVRIEDIKRRNRESSRERAFKRRAEEIQDLALDQVAEMLDAADEAANAAGEERDVALDERDDSAEHRRRAFIEGRG